MAAKTVLSIVISFVLVFRFSTCLLHEEERNNVYIRGEGVVTDSECGDLISPENTFSTLLEVAKSLSSHSTIHVCGAQIEIEDPITFRNLTDIVLNGMSANTTIKCAEPGAGLEFSGITNLSITNLKLIGCGAVHESTTQINVVVTDSTLQFNSGVYIINCTNVHISHIHIFNCSGTGLVLYDTNGTVEVLHSIFDQNCDASNQLGGGGGVHIEFTKCTPGVYCNDFIEGGINLRSSSSKYTILNCTFSNNRAVLNGPKYLLYKERRRLDHQGLGRGGGLAILLNGDANSNHFMVEDCTIESNQATWGGGIYIVFQDKSANNSVHLSQLTIRNNKCNLNGGGGVDLGFNIFETSNNEVLFDQCTFLKNTAMYGGGTRIYSSKNMEPNEQKFNKVKFINCIWEENEARFGSAIDIAPHVWEILSSGFLPTPVFENCIFNSNRADDQPSNFDELEYKEYHTGRGAVMLTKFTANFTGSMTFEGNAGCALFLSSSVISVAPNSSVTFTNNNAFQGGAIEFLGFSAMFVRENSYFYFKRNRATRRGGAIFAYSIDKHNFVSSRSCFLQYHGSVQGVKKNVTFEFTRNVAGNNSPHNPDCLALGHSIFSASLESCFFACNPLNKNPSRDDTFNCIGKFIYTEDINCEVSSSGGKFDVNKTIFTNGQLFAYPGKELELPISIKNDFEQTINAVYYAVIENNKESSIITKQEHSYISDRRIQLFGKPGDSATLKLQKVGFRDLAITMKITLRKCPPGYVLISDMERELALEKCVCSAVRMDLSYAAIRECDDTSFEAYLSRGYWLGYQGNESEENLRYGHCPTGYCFPNRSHSRFLTIPSDASKDDLDRMVCGQFRTGTLCGQCRASYSVHYHSKNLQCESNSTCKYGWLLYIITELLPLTVLFVLTTVLNISFTSGAINGFILFAQVFDSFPITGDSFIIFPASVYRMYQVTRMVYNLFNFDFFSHDSLSFCLWEGATSLDMLIFKLLTVVYAIFLVLTTVLLMKYCNIFHKCPCLRYSTVKSSVIHGLSSVLVMVYSQCIKVCFRILSFAYIHSKGRIFDQNVVYVQGNIRPFTGEHIKYAVVSLISLLIIIVPQLLLLVYPACFKLLNLLRCSDSNKAAKFVFHTPYSKLKPFLDSFQSCFKDDCRIFAGFYFVYRILIIAATLYPRLTGVFELQGFFLLSFLVLHAIAQPYRERWHNILDGLLIFNLAVITKITRFNYDYSKYYADESQTDPLPFSTSFQIVLMNLPLLYMLVYAVGNIVLRIRTYCRRKKQSSSSNIDMDRLEGEDDNEFPARMLDDQDSESDNEGIHYQPFDQVMYDLPRYSL